MSYLILPIIFLKFWFLEAPLRIIKYFIFINSQFLHFFSLPLMVRTLFKPWKNEYRKQFIMVAIGIGFFVKLFFIAADFILLIFLLVIETIAFVFFEIWPILAIYLFFK